jgi:hypothetical protein
MECREEERTKESDNIRRNKHEKCTKREMNYGMYSGGGVRCLKKLRVCRSEPFTMLKTILFH